MGTPSNVTKLPTAKKVAPKKGSKKATVQKVVQLLQHSKDTTGTYMFKAVDEKGSPLDQRESAVSTIYVRKEALTGKAAFVRVTVEHFDSLKDMVGSAASAEDED